MLSHLVFARSREGWASDIVLFGARVYAGLTIAQAGFDKLPTPDWMVDQVTRVGWFPAPPLFASLACLTEAVAGLLLVFGLFTRLSSLMLAFTLGVAAFGFHRVMPLTGMHITQGFFWLFVVTAVLGPGRLSVDHLLLSLGGSSPQRKFAWCIASVVAAICLVPSLYFEFLYDPPEVVAAEADIEKMNVAGSFSAWDLNRHAMEQGEGTRWTCEIAVEQAGLIEFKFVANQSWDMSLGDDDQEAQGMPVAGIGASSGGNIVAYVPNPGTYRFTIDTDAKTYRVEPTTDEIVAEE